MSLVQFFGAYNRLRVQTEAFAALGARLGAADDELDPAVLAALDEVVAAVGFPDAGSLAPEQRSVLADMVRSSFRQALATLDAPAGNGGWGHTDVEVLDGQGRASTNLVPHMARIMGDTPVREVLDVGTGVGLLAIAIARRWPDANVVGIDIWEPALERARHHVVEAGLGDRIEIRNQDITALDEGDRYDCAWLPAPFLPSDVLAAAVPRVIEAVRPGGLVSIGTLRRPEDPLAAATQRLRNIADTGAVHTIDSVLALCHAAGLDAAVLNPDADIPIAFVGGWVR
jgi:2-polyprenyl-3-methyl-5-hydroxy-6-metoxy-1,4-benzoquinol methylase